MRRLVSAGPDGSLWTAAQWTGGRERTYFLLPRAEYEALLLDVPPVRGERLEAALPYRIRAQYPGPTESTVLDHRPVPGDSKRLLVFAADRNRLEPLRALAGKSALIAPTLLLAEIPAQGSRIEILWSPSWVEVARFEGQAIAASRLLTRTGDAAADLEAALSGDEGRLPVTVALTRDADDDRQALAQALSRREGTPGASRVARLEELLPRPPTESCEIFRSRPSRSARLAPILLRVLAVLALFLAAAIPYRIAGRKEAELASLKAEYERLKTRSSEIMEQAAELDRLTARKRELEASERPDAYRMLADISKGAGEGVRIRSLVIEGDTFRFEADGSDGLTVLHRMQASGLFGSVELRQSVAEAGGGERYILSGRMRDD